MARQTAAQKIYETLRAARDEQGESAIQSKDVATIIRGRLKVAFPGVKFSVTSDYNSVDVRWTDGPIEDDVEAITGQYRFGGFDGMIDLAYSSKNWLMPDGSMEHAATSGTVGSMGTVEASYTDCPVPGAIIVKYGPKYVFCQRRLSDERLADLVRGAVEYYGCEFDPDQPAHSQYCRRQGQWITTLAYRFERIAAGHRAP